MTIQVGGGALVLRGPAEMQRRDTRPAGKRVGATLPGAARPEPIGRGRGGRLGIGAVPASVFFWPGFLFAMPGRLAG